MVTASVEPSPPETTDLERRILAHERILQSLIAYMSRTEPRFVDHLRDRFVEPMKMARHEHDYRDVDDHAEEFIRAVIRIGETPEPRSMTERQGASLQKVSKEKPMSAIPYVPAIYSDRVQIKQRSLSEPPIPTQRG